MPTVCCIVSFGVTIVTHDYGQWSGLANYSPITRELNVVSGNLTVYYKMP